MTKCPAQGAYAFRKDAKNVIRDGLVRAFPGP